MAQRYSDLRHTIEFTDDEVNTLLAVMQDGVLKTRLKAIQKQKRDEVDVAPDKALREALGSQAGDVTETIARLRQLGWDVTKV